MKRTNRTLALLTLGLMAVLTACNSRSSEMAMPFYQDPNFTPQWIDKGAKGYQEIHKIPEFSFTNQDGEVVDHTTVENKIYVADFFFTFCPGICPKLTKNMSTLQNEFINDQDVLLLSHSVTPWIDSVSVLKEYAELNDIISGKWHLLTGSKESIYKLARQGYFAEKDIGKQQDSTSFLHTENFLLIDKQRRIRGIYNGTLPVEMNRLIEDIHILKEE